MFKLRPKKTPLMVAAVKTKEAIFYVNEISLLYTVAGLCAPLERMKERPGNAFWKKTAMTLLSQRLKEVDLAKRLQLVYVSSGNSSNHRNHSELYNYSCKSERNGNFYNSNEKLF